MKTSQAEQTRILRSIQTVHEDDLQAYFERLREIDQEIEGLELNLS